MVVDRLIYFFVRKEMRFVLYKGSILIVVFKVLLLLGWEVNYEVGEEGNFSFFLIDIVFNYFIISLILFLFYYILLRFGTLFFGFFVLFLFSKF